MAIIKPEQLSSGSYNISGSFSGSFQGDGSGLNNLPVPSVDTGSLVTTASFDAFTGSYNTGSFTGSFTGDGSGLTNIPTQSFETGSFVTTASFDAFTGSYNTGSFTGSFTGSLLGTASTASYALSAVSASHASTASSVNNLNQDVLISGSFTVVGDSIFYGSSSFTYVTASQLAVSASFISVNVFEPAQRFGGLKVYDSGSSLATASLAWDSLHNHWVYENVDGATYTGGMLLSGPRNTGSLGDEPNLTKWFVPRSDGGDHLNDSQIYSSASTHVVTGSLTVTQGITASLEGTASYATQALSASFAPSTPAFPFTGSARITGSLSVTGSFSLRGYTGSADTITNIISTTGTQLVKIGGDGAVSLGTYTNPNTKFTANGTENFISYFGGGNSTSRVIYAEYGASTLNGASAGEFFTRIGVGSTAGNIHYGLKVGADTGNSNITARGLYSLVNSAGTNVAGYFDAVNGVNNYAIITQRGFSGFGQTAPAAVVDIKASGSTASDLTFRIRNDLDNTNVMSVLGTRDVFLGSSITPAGGGHLFNIRNGLGTSIPFAYFDNASFNLDIDRFCNIKFGFGLVGVTSATHTLLLGTGSVPTGRNFGQTMAAWTAISQGTNDSGFAQTGGDTSGNNAVYYNYIGKNWTLGGITQGNGKNVLALITGSTPTNNISSAFQLYASTGSVTSNTRPHFRTENGTVVWLGDESRLFNVTASRTIISSSQNTVSGSSLIVYGSGSTQPVLTVQGSQGELFSITDVLSGSLFSVNDISGLPILEVFSDNTTLIGNYLDPMLITTAKITQTNSGSFVVYSLPTSSYDTAFFEYSVRSGLNARAGTIMAIQSGSSVNFTETTTTSFGSTSDISFTVIVTGSNIALTGSSATSLWTIKTIVRGI